MLESAKVRIIRLLRWSERYTKTDMVYLMRGSFWMIASQAAAAIIAFGLAIAFANLIPREIYGNYKYILSLAAILGTISLSGLGTYVTQSVGRGLEGALRRSFNLNLIWSIPMVMLSLGMAAYYGFSHNWSLTVSLIAIAFFSPFLNSAQLYASFLSGKQDFKRAAMYNFLITVFQAACIFAALYIFHAGVIALVLTYFAANTAATLSCYAATLYIFRPNEHFDRDMSNFSVRLSFSNIVGSFVGQLDKIVLFHFVGAGPVAVYSLAQAPVVQMRAALKLSTPLALPKLSALDSDTIKQTLRGKMNRFLAAIIIMVLVYILLAPYMFHLVFPHYLDAVLYSQAYALILLMFPKKLISVALYAKERRRGQYTLSLVSPIVQTVLLVILVPLMGIWGAVVAEFGSNFVSNIVANYYFRQFQRET